MSPRDPKNPGGEAPVPPAAKKLTVKQEREQRRLAKVEAFKKQQARAKRNRIIAISLSSVAAVAVVALIVTIVVTSSTPARDPESIDIAGLETWSDIDYTHTNEDVDYEALYGMTPPAGGSHNQYWLNCGIYEEPQTEENAVHALEHGAVWVTYNPEDVAGDDLETLRDSLPGSYIILSPIEGLEAPVVASAWGAQVMLDGVDDERLGDFIEKYWQSGDVPEPGARCDGAIDGPGKLA
ncbi:DUF3105 domain-containing protein [Salinibacterium sp. SYSU T00001]|uniref:DUF3105 domain-containing protein n=1 Tax=Homoserinimonas sedimenticola TaxID=2986805 RepID=UPI002235EF92|nr:DUF3105 domain-containing protein [Salinibacterium sedimenticola]MCW4385229.1 DUF3105 domain-containing protein [Salinibacterium sedimenticola]